MHTLGTEVDRDDQARSIMDEARARTLVDDNVIGSVHVHVHVKVNDHVALRGSH
jgi:hypothetical protein